MIVIVIALSLWLHYYITVLPPVVVSTMQQILDLDPNHDLVAAEELQVRVRIRVTTGLCII